MIHSIDAGVVPYEEALARQRDLADLRRRKLIPDTLLLLEHPSVFTFGKRDASEDLKVEESELKRRGMDVVKTDRGGRVTYHGPGQLVGYLIFEWNDFVPKLVTKIEECLLKALAEWGVAGERDPEFPGIWIGKKKIAALGLHVEGHVTTHGFSLNVSCDLKPYELIHPCGIRDRDVTSLEVEIGRKVAMSEVKERMKVAFSEGFETRLLLD